MYHRENWRILHLNTVIDHNDDDKVELAEFLNLAEIVFWTKIEEEEEDEYLADFVLGTQRNLAFATFATYASCIT